MTDLTNTDAKDNAMIVDSMTPDAPDYNPETTEATDDAGIQKIYLKDYTPPSYSVEKVELDIKLFEDHATVDSVLTMKRQHPGDLVLLGQNMDLTAISINDKALKDGEYQLDEGQLTVSDAPDDAVVKISVRHEPQKNTELEGLYIAGEGDDVMFVTQCEPEGFRKITYYPDRPDVLSVFTTRLEADKKFPTLLANGDLIESGEVEGDSNRHYAIWHDVSKKPSYLFACVFADLAVLEDSYTTIEGRDVKLQIYAKAYDIDKCHVAMQALKDSMHWDEENYFREIKSDLQQGLLLRSKLPQLVLQEFWGLMIAYNLIRRLMRYMALRAKVSPLRISFHMASITIVDLLRFAPLQAAGLFPKLLDAVLEEGKLFVIPERRKRSCPRVVKGKPQKYPKKNTSQP